jgi:signal peptide peptidase SppA
MIENLWLGTEASYEAYEKLLAMGEDSRSKMQKPTYYTAQKGVAVFPIRGSLISGKAGWMSFFGVTGYDDIQEGLVQAVADPKVKSILLEVDSPGGHVAGVVDAAEFISKVAKVKPMVTFTSGMMASAGLWLGATTGNVVTSKTAEIGSVGVLTVHVDRTKQHADNGLKVTVIRAGKNKARANSYEALTDDAREQIQAQADHIEGIFIQHLAEHLGVPLKNAKAQFGEGKLFIGQQAVDAGLAHLVSNFDGAFSIAEALAGPM